MRIPGNLQIDNPAFPLLSALISYVGITTANGNALGTTLICAGLALETDYTGYGIKVLDTAAAGQVLLINSDVAGTVAVDGFKNAAGAPVQIPAGTRFVILSVNLKGIQTIIAMLNAIAGGAYWSAFGPNNIQVGNAVTQGVTVFDPGGGIIPAANITAGTYTIDRIRAGVSTNIVAASPSSKVNGSVYNSYAYPGASWSPGDLSLVTFSGIIIVISGISTNLPPIQVYSRIVIEPDIQTTVNTINTVQGAMADAAHVGAVDNLTTSLSYLKELVTAILLIPTTPMRGTDNAALAATALSTATWTAARAAYLDHLVGVISTGTFSLVNNILEQDALIVAATGQQVDIELDVSNLTQSNTIREYVQVDGANYRQISAKVFPTNFDTGTKAVLFSFNQKNTLYKITMQAAVLEGGAKNVPFRIMQRDLS